ncbi:restriction endonuclease subunit S [Streptococcus mitis]|nr:restriction endonuclease subunit S [Streptococcus mitis]
MSKISKIRFKGYSEEVRRKLLKQLVKLDGRIGFRGYTKQDIVERSNGVLAYSPTNILNNKIVNGKNDTYISQAKYEESPEIMVKKNNILFVKTGSTLGKSSLVRELTEPATINPQLIVIKTIHVDSDYLAVYLLTDSIQKQIFQAKIGGAVPTLTETEIGKFVISLPSLAEQSAIGSLFRTLDELLASYKDNLANYQSLKTTMLSKMFPKAGQTVPEIRLDGFEGEWECLKIAEIFQIIDGDRGKSYPGESDFYSVGHTLFLDTGNVKKSGLDFSTTKFISEEKDKELRNGKLILGDFILTSRGTLGNVAYYNENIQKRYSSVRINSAMLILRPLLGDKISPDYILAVLRGNLISDFMKVNQVGSAQPHITKKEFSKIKVLVPSNIQEQQAIGAYFSNLEQLITSYQDKITQLETLKKKLLQDMFI